MCLTVEYLGSCPPILASPVRISVANLETVASAGYWSLIPRRGVGFHRGILMVLLMVVQRSVTVVECSRRIDHTKGMRAGLQILISATWSSTLFSVIPRSGILLAMGLILCAFVYNALGRCLCFVFACTPDLTDLAMVTLSSVSK